MFVFVHCLGNTRPLALSGADDHAGQAREGEERRQEQRRGVRVRHEGQTARGLGKVCE